MSDAHAATQREEQTFRVFEGEPHYIDGYTPSSLDSQHSSLQRSSTWLGMGFILTSLAGLLSSDFPPALLEPRKMEAPTLLSAQCWPFPAWSLDSVSSTTGAVTTAPTWLPPAASTKTVPLRGPEQSDSVISGVTGTSKNNRRRVPSGMWRRLLGFGWDLREGWASISGAGGQACLERTFGGNPHPSALLRR